MPFLAQSSLCPSCLLALLSEFALLDYKTGFGGKFGVQSDRQDKSAVGWDHLEKVDKHHSQQGETSTSLKSVHR